MTGIQNQLKEEIEKRSEKLERNAKHLQVYFLGFKIYEICINKIIFKK